MDTWTKVDKGQWVTEWRGKTIVWPGFDEKLSYNLFVSSPRNGIVYYCMLYGMHCILYYCIWYAWYIILLYMVYGMHGIHTFLTMSSKLGLRADAPIVVQPHWKSICRQRYNQYSSAIAALHPHYVLWNRIDKYKGFCDKRCPWTKLFLDLAKVADVNIATSNKTSFLFWKIPLLLSNRRLFKLEIDIFSWPNT